MITLERATEVDIPALLEIEGKLDNVRKYSPMLDRYGWAEEFGKCEVYLIKKNGTVVGNTSYSRDGDKAYVSGLAITPEFQHQGIGKDVLCQILEKLKDVPYIWLVTHPENKASLKLYNSFGFLVESRKENYFGDGKPRLVLSRKK